MFARVMMLLMVLTGDFPIAVELIVSLYCILYFAWGILSKLVDGDEKPRIW